MLAEDIAKMMAMIPLDEAIRRDNETDKIKGGAFDQVMEGKTPFMFKGGEGINAGVGEVDWVINKDRYKYDSIFDTLNPIDGKVSGASAKSKSRRMLFKRDFKFFVSRRDDQVKAAQQRPWQGVEIV